MCEIIQIKLSQQVMNSSLFVAMFYTDIEITQIFIFLYRSSKLYFQTESTVKYWCFRLIGFHNELSTKNPKSIHISATSMSQLQGGFQLEFVNISRVINHMTCYKFECSHWSKLQHSDWRANIVKDFLKINFPPMRALEL